MNNLQIEIAKNKLEEIRKKYPGALRADQYLIALQKGETGEALKEARPWRFTKARNGMEWIDLSQRKINER